MALPTTMKGLLFHEDKSIKLDTSLPFPAAVPGSVTVRVLATMVNPNLVHMVRSAPGAHTFTYPRPNIPGSFVMGRIVSCGEDATVLSEGQLVMTEYFVRARDDPSVQILGGMHDGGQPATRKLASVWRDSSYAEYIRSPLENTYALDERRLCGPVSEGGLGYTINDLTHFAAATVPYGGFRSINLQAGETVIVSPATGHFSGGAIAAALAIGASVIAVSRSAQGLSRVKATFPSVRTVQLSGNDEEDTEAILTASGTHPPDAFIDLSPPAATGFSSVTACMMAVKIAGRIVLMGGRGDPNIPIPWPLLLIRNLTVKGGFMYEREDVRQLIRLVENGQFKLGKENGYEIAGTYKLEEWEQAADAAVEHTTFGKLVLLTP